MLTSWKDYVAKKYNEGLRPIRIAHIMWDDPSWGYETCDCGSFDSWYNRVRHYIYRHLKSNASPELEGQTNIFEQKPVIIQNNEPSIHDAIWNGTHVIRFGLIGDTQMGSKYTQLTHLHDFYNICKNAGIRDIYHTGDITDGLKMRQGHEYELYLNSVDDMVNDVVDNYPKIDGITTHFITGNHDASLYKQVGYDIGKAIAERRSDMDYLGRDCSVVNITPNCTLEMRHPWDGTAYALSYKPQKMIEAMESDSKPNILAIGHYHKAEYLFYRNVHCIQTGCFQSQTPYTRGKGIAVNMGGWIVTVVVNDDGTIAGISPMFVPYYKACTDDYKNFRKD